MTAFKRTGVLVAAALALLAASALARTFGAEPVAVSSGARAPSGGATISGDDRRVRYVAYHSHAPDLVAGDTNRTLDVFVHERATAQTLRASVSRRGRQANGPSVNPALDGSVQRGPRCVAFQSQATNLARGDRDRAWDVYVRDLRARTTRLVSRGVRRSAVDPAISGDCRQVAFTSAGRIYLGNGLTPRRARVVARGTNPDLSLDGSALAWERGHGVWLKRRGRSTRVARIGGNPRVSDGGASRTWSVVYDGASDVYMKVFKSRGGARRALLVSGRDGMSLGGRSHNGGITAYAWPRGIVTFTNTQGGRTTLWYLNLHTGNIDDLAHANTDGERPAIFDVATSARANYAVFSSTESYRQDTNGGMQDVYLKFIGGK